MFFGTFEDDMKEFQYSILRYNTTEDVAFFGQENDEKMASLSQSLFLFREPNSIWTAIFRIDVNNVITQNQRMVILSRKKAARYKSILSKILFMIKWT